MGRADRPHLAQLTTQAHFRAITKSCGIDPIKLTVFFEKKSIIRKLETKGT